jgi:DNA-directed RNA polymerase specialized sigma24 family protein
MAPMTSDEEIERLVASAAAADDAAWHSLWAAIETPLSRIIAQPRFLGRLGQREDDRRNIVVAVMARLRADSFGRLRQYLDAKTQNPRLRFMSWLRVVAKRVGIDYLRSHPDYVRRHDANASRPGAWVDAEELPSASQIFGDRPQFTNAGTAQELLESFDEIAKQLKLPNATAAERVVRAVIERLRRRFRENEEMAT